MKLCKDCEHSVIDSHEALCYAPQAQREDPVYGGRMLVALDCYNERTKCHSCGHDARYYEPREPQS